MGSAKPDFFDLWGHTCFLLSLLFSDTHLCERSLVLRALVAAVVASPANRKRRPAVTLEGNPFESYTLHANSHYSSLVEAAIGNLSDSSLEPAAQVVKETGTFLWL